MEELVSLIRALESHEVSNPAAGTVLTDSAFLGMTDDKTVGLIDAIDEQVRAVLTIGHGVVNLQALAALRALAIEVCNVPLVGVPFSRAIVIICRHGKLVVPV